LWSEKTGRDLSPLFDQYLRSTSIPTLEIKKSKHEIFYRWADCNSNFDAPVLVTIDGNMVQWLEPSTQWKKIKAKGDMVPDKNFYVGFRKAE
jgi:hypothetical protein